MSDLFSHTADPSENLLPEDGVLNYFGPVMEKEQSEHYFRLLMDSIDWKNDEAIVFGKRIVTKRKTGWYGNKAYDYTYSGILRKALPWTAELLELKRLAEKLSGDTFNSCLLNLYHSGEEGVSWHSDDEKMLKPHGTVASLSFGAERMFQLKHKQKDLKAAVLLEPGSLLLMKGAIQLNWLHSLPKTKKMKLPRINLTFRTILET
ncbi:MAG: DNA-N1-methyladenine dioxygenase [Bacteroidetes bacterium]|jgi:alkylated DNA repair dioxygenase AlkB|nr:DNA-N1-methyladenine dioxygenase [Bacteroidota bacterium]